MLSQELLYSLALRRIPGIGDVNAKRLINKFGSASALFKASSDLPIKVKGLKNSVSNDLKNPKYISQAQEEFNFMFKNNIKCWGFWDKDYPPLLKHCADAPTVLFYKGNINFKNKRVISIVGTRNMTAYGQDFLSTFIKELQPYNPLIVSGFAYGIDIAAQRLASKYGLQTVGCLAHGLHYLYPRAHLKYAEDIMNNGGFISDFWSTDSILEQNFVTRNRIIAGISEASIVIESDKKGGSLITANMAWSYNREVFAVPGKVFDTYSRGCNNLIKAQKATVLTGTDDLIEALCWKEIKDTQKKIQKSSFTDLNEEEKQIATYLLEKGKSLIDIISRDCKIPTYQLSSLLLKMELKGVVRPLPGKRFELL